MAQAERMMDIAPRPQRWDCNFATVARDASDKEYPLRIANISNGGFMAEVEGKLSVGSLITFELPGKGEVQAQVRWAIGNRLGAMILED